MIRKVEGTTVAASFWQAIVEIRSKTLLRVLLVSPWLHIVVQNQPFGQQVEGFSDCWNESYVRQGKVSGIG